MAQIAALVRAELNKSSDSTEPFVESRPKAVGRWWLSLALNVVLLVFIVLSNSEGQLENIQQPQKAEMHRLQYALDEQSKKLQQSQNVVRRERQAHKKAFVSLSNCTTGLKSQTKKLHQSQDVVRHQRKTLKSQDKPMAAGHGCDCDCAEQTKKLQFGLDVQTKKLHQSQEVVRQQRKAMKAANIDPKSSSSLLKADSDSAIAIAAGDDKCEEFEERAKQLQVGLDEQTEKLHQSQDVVRQLKKALQAAKIDPTGANNNCNCAEQTKLQAEVNEQNAKLQNSQDAVRKERKHYKHLMKTLKGCASKDCKGILAKIGTDA